MTTERKQVCQIHISSLVVYQEVTAVVGVTDSIALIGSFQYLLNLTKRFAKNMKETYN